MSKKAKRSEIERKIRSLEDQKRKVEIDLSKFPSFPHSGMTQEEIELYNLLEVLSRELSRASEEYTNSLHDESNDYLMELSQDSKRVKWLTIALVVLTALLSVGTILDFMTRFEILK